ncbi:MAG: tetratricopeptide repeat protein [Armatimonadia bacterium]
MNRKTKKITGWLVVIALIIAVQPLARRVSLDRLVLGINPPTPWTRILARSNQDPELAVTGVTGVIVGAILGGFREVAASMLWMKTDTLWDKGEGTHAQALWTMRLTTLLDPHWLEPWRITGWHLAYNMFVETDDPKEKAKFLQMGVDSLKEGVSWNPDRYDLYFELGWTYFDKVRDYEEAAKWMQAAIQFPHPEYIDRMIAHAFERLPDMPRALDWYDYCLKRNPTDGTAAGATITIRERYLPAWKLMEQGKYDEAIAAIDKWLLVEPNSTLGLHMKGLIYERAGNLEGAYEAWKLAGETSALNAHAQAKAVEIAHKLGKPVPEVAQSLFREKAKGGMGISRPEEEAAKKN